MCSQAFLDWCRAMGVDAPAVAPALIPVALPSPDGGSSSSSTTHYYYRGLVATRALKPGDAIATVPATLLLSATGSAARDPFLGPLLLASPQKQQPPLTHHQILVVHLLVEAAKGRRGAWHPYLRELPRGYAVLAAWPRRARRMLQAPHAVRASERAAESARRDWLGARGVLRRALGAVVAGAGGGGAQEEAGDGDGDETAAVAGPPWSSPSPPSSFAAWLWALGAALSRTMHYRAGDRAGCLTPFADLLNHAPPAGAPWAPDPLEELAGVERSASEDGGEGEEERAGDEDEKAACVIAGDGALDEAAGAYVLRTRRSVPAGQEALLSYGRHTNLELLSLYGFLLPWAADAAASAPNPDDRAPLPRRHVRAAVRATRATAATTGAAAAWSGGGDDNDDDKDEDDGEDEDDGGDLTGTYSAPLASHGGGGSTSAAASMDGEWYVHAAAGRPSWALFDTLRLRAAAAPAAAARSSPSPSCPPSPCPPTPLQQALLVERWIRAACMATLRELPTTAEEDEAWLSRRGAGEPGDAAAAADDRDDDHHNDDDSGDDDPFKIGAECARLAVEWRLQYKRALLRCVARCDRALAKGAAKEEAEGEARAAATPTRRSSPIRRGRVIALGGGGGKK